ncbi:MAG: hypothetical protein HOV67_03355 [Kribbellaceae bacterium]|nr:hypothetical protein [Kribbellaceae bacterium]
MTDDLRDLLRVAAAEGQDAVDLAEDAVVERIRSRRARSRRLSAGALATVGTSVIAAAVWAVLPGGRHSPTAGQPVDGVPRIVTSDTDSLSGMEAALVATLTADANGCVRAGEGAESVTLVWPRGYTVRGDAQSFQVLDSGNQVVAQSGVRLTIGGGGADNFHVTWTGKDCAGNGRLWMVGHVSR